MKKSKYKIRKSQIGGSPNREDFGDNEEAYLEALDNYIMSLKQDDLSEPDIRMPSPRLQTSTSRFQEIKNQQLPIKTGLSSPSSIRTIDQNEGTYYDFSKGFKIFNAAAQLTTGLANKIQDAKNRREEYKQYLESIQPPASEVEFEEGLNDNPLYLKYGGLSAEKAKKILRDGTIHGQKLTTKQKKYFGWIAGGGKPKMKEGGCEYCEEMMEEKMEGYHLMPDGTMMPDTEMMKKGGWIQKAIKHPGRCKNPGSPDCPKGSPQYNLAMRFKHGDLKRGQYGLEEVEGVTRDQNPIVEAEEGEVFTTRDGNIQKVAEGAGTHEEGGVLLNNVERVLEDTSDKRKDRASRVLKVSPLMAKLLADVDTKTDLSHSKVMEKAKEKQGKQLDKIQRALEKNTESLSRVPNNKYAKNSMDMNIASLQNIPSEGEIFDSLFQHQELVKAMFGINENTAKCGGKYSMKKAQIGTGSNWRPVRNPKFDPKEWVYRGGKWYRIKEQSDEPTGAMAEVKTLPGVTVRGAAKKATTPSPAPSFNLSFVDPIITDESTIKRPAPDVDATAYTNTAVEGVGEGMKEGYNMGDVRATGTQTSINQPNNRFFEPIRWFDVAGPISSLIEGRVPVRYNPVNLNQIRLRKQSPLPQMQQAQADYNAALALLPRNAVGMANLANIFSKKYGIDNQILGQIENINRDIENRQIMYNASVRDRQEAANQAARELFEGKYLGSLEAERQQKKQAWDDLFQTLALNRKLNREGNLLMKLFPAFNQFGEYSGYKYKFRNPLQVSTNG